EQGSNDGVGASTRFTSPDGVALVGNDLYVLDTNNSDLRKINISTKAVSTVAGTANISGTEDGKSAVAHFNLPTQIASDGKGHLYITDSGNSTIRQMTIADGTVKTIGGQPQTPGKADGPLTKSQYSGPRGIVVVGDAVYVADTGNDIIRKIDVNSMQTSTFAGSGEEGKADGTGPAAQFSNPGAMCTDGGTIYLMDADNHAIRKINPASAEVTTLTLVNGHIGSGCTVSADGKTLYFSDTTENSVQQVDTSNGNFQGLYPPGS
ncbi:MAG TPA: hypothetical protein VIX12_05905, partial [Candidatus Binataceae bacterium]